MTPEGHNELNPLLEQHLRAADRPMTSYDLYDIPEIRQVANSVNRISNYLGVMFRRGILSRISVDGASAGQGRTRWGYVWRDKTPPAWLKGSEAELKNYKPKALLERPNLIVSEDGNYLTLDMPEITIQIEIRKK